MTKGTAKGSPFKRRIAMNDDILLRPAQLKDAAALLNIYKPYITDTIITFEYDVPTLEEFTERVRDISSKFPYIVAEENKEILGYAYAHTFRERAAYNWSVETSIYVSLSKRRSGIGRLLYDELERLLIKQNITSAIACVSYPNPDSIRFHESLGYKTVGHIEKCAYKLGQWCDIVFMEKLLTETYEPPKTVLPASEL